MIEENLKNAVKDPAKLKHSLSGILSEGWYSVSVNNGLNAYSDINPAENLIKFYLNLQDKASRLNFENAAIGLLRKELATPKRPYSEISDIIKGECIERNKKENFEFYETDSMRGVVKYMLMEWKADRRRDPQDKFYKKASNFPLLQKEWVLGLYSMLEQKEKLAKALETADFDIAKLPPYAVLRLENLALKGPAVFCTERIEKEFSKQYYCMLGLLDIIAELSLHSEALRKEAGFLLTPYKKIKRSEIAGGRPIVYQTIPEKSVNPSKHLMDVISKVCVWT